MSNEIKSTQDAIQSIFGQFGVSKSLSVVTVGGVESVQFWAMHDGEFVKHFVRGREVIRAGFGRIAGSMGEALAAVARGESVA